MHKIDAMRTAVGRTKSSEDIASRAMAEAEDHAQEKKEAEAAAARKKEEEVAAARAAMDLQAQGEAAA